MPRTPLSTISQKNKREELTHFTFPYREKKVFCIGKTQNFVAFGEIREVDSNSQIVKKKKANKNYEMKKWYQEEKFKKRLTSNFFKEQK